MAAGDHRLHDDERRAWAEDGFFRRTAVFAEAELEALRAAAERAAVAAEHSSGSGRTYDVDGNRYVDIGETTIQFEHQPGSRTLRVVEPFHHLDPSFDALLDDPRIVEPICGLLGSERVALWTDKLNFKRPFEGSGFRWHQDSPYWAHACRHLDQLPNVMVALDDADAENGCLRVVRGSHRHGLLPGRRGEGVLGPLFTDPRHIDLAAEVPAAMPAGSLLFFSAHTVHGSEPNRSGRARRACVLTYQPPGHPMFKMRGCRESAAPGAAAGGAG
ncbi:MAG TPA: phytanoyl-CoA dioxygenase family protein [Myxococcota bacterium]|nr:phytanoyl-CoA dioxygenase family protein [Myxococcota bacterium]